MSDCGEALRAIEMGPIGFVAASPNFNLRLVDRGIALGRGELRKLVAAREDS
jgi:hypothetical protein